MAYTPPVGSAVPLAFVSGYVAPPGASINLDPTPLGNVRQATIPGGGVGTPRLIRYPFLYAKGLDSLVFGRHEIDRTSPKIAPASIDPTSVVGTPTYVSWRRFLVIDAGIDPPGWPLGSGRIRLVGGYNAPPAINVILNWTGEPYSVPPATNVILEFGSLGSGHVLGATLFDQMRFGTPTIDQQLGISPVGLPTSNGFGTTSVELSITGLRPVGWLSDVFGASTQILKLALGASVGGIAPPPSTGTNSLRQVPDPELVAYRIRYITPAGAIYTVVPVPIVTRDIQFINQAGLGINSAIYGTTTFTLKNREIQPAFVQSMVFGTAVVKRIVYVVPAGWDSAFISQNAEVVINTRRIYVLTGAADPAGYGVASFKNFNTLVNPVGAVPPTPASPTIYNFRKYVVVAPYSENTDPTAWTNFYPFVDNKIRYMRTFGHVDSKFPFTHVISNRAAPLRPAGLDATIWGSTLIAPRIRTVFGIGWNSFYNTQYTVVFNSARVIYPTTLGDTSKFGKPDPVLNLNRTVTQHSGWVGPIMGTAFIAPRIRYVAPNLFYDVPASFPEVRHNPYPIAPVGIPWQGQVGGAAVHIFLRQAFPFSVNVHSVPWVGEPAVANRNRSFQHFGNDVSFYGKPDIQNYIRYITYGDIGPETYGSTLIERRTKEIIPGPISVPPIAVIHRIRKDSPDPPSPQRIQLDKYDPDGGVIDGFGIYGTAIGVVATRLATIYAEGFVRSSKFGTAVVRSTAIQPRFIFDDGLFGIPTMIFTRYLLPIGVLPSSDPSKFIRMTPWTIFAPAGDQRPLTYTPWNQTAHAIDDLNRSDPYGTQRPWFGRSSVELKNRRIGPIPDHGDFNNHLDGEPKFGTSAFTLRRQVVFPSAIRSLRFGQVIFLDVPQYVDLNNEFQHAGIAPSTQWGVAVLAPPPIEPDINKHVYPLGFIGVVPSTHRVELLNRTIFTTGIVHRGNPEQGLTSPYGTPLVGYPRTYSIGMGVQTSWGTHVIEYKNRTVLPVGYNSLSLEDGNIDDFRFRMRVTRINPPAHIAGIPSTLAFGACVVAHFMQDVLARGIDGYNSGAHTVGGSATIHPDGLNSAVFGDIDRWEAGKIKAHGDDLSVLGTPRLGRLSHQTGYFDGVVSVPRIASSVRLSGFQDGPFTFEGPTVTNNFGCTNRVVTVSPIISTQSIPAPRVLR